MIWKNGSIHDLNSLVPASSPPTEDARAINDEWGIVTHGSGHALLLVPDERDQSL